MIYYVIDKILVYTINIICDVIDWIDDKIN